MKPACGIIWRARSRRIVAWQKKWHLKKTDVQLEKDWVLERHIRHDIFDSTITNMSDVRWICAVDISIEIRHLCTRTCMRKHTYACLHAVAIKASL